MPGKSLLRSDLESVRVTREIDDLLHATGQRETELRASELARDQLEQNINMLELRQNIMHKPIDEGSLKCREGSVRTYYKQKLST